MTQKPLTKLLIVDDDQDLLTVAKYSLASLQGVEVRCVASGEAAMEEALSFLPDLILLDYRMPKMDGLATLKAMRALTKLAAIPIVFFTASALKEDFAKFLKEGAVAIISKPFDALALPTLIRDIWAKI